MDGNRGRAGPCSEIPSPSTGALLRLRRFAHVKTLKRDPRTCNSWCDANGTTARFCVSCGLRGKKKMPPEHFCNNCSEP